MDIATIIIAYTSRLYVMRRSAHYAFDPKVASEPVAYGLYVQALE